MRLLSGEKHHLRKSADRKRNQSGERNERLLDLCFAICRFSQVVFIPRTQLHAQYLFLFPIVFGINLIHFFDGKKDGAAEHSMACSLLQSLFAPFHLREAERRVRFLQRVRILGNGKCELSAIWEGRD